VKMPLLGDAEVKPFEIEYSILEGVVESLVYYHSHYEWIYEILVR